MIYTSKGDSLSHWMPVLSASQRSTQKFLPLMAQ